MIKRLRQKFIGIAMLSMFVVLAIIIGAINIMNYQNIVRDADAILTLLSDNGGYFPKIKHPEEKKPFPYKDMSPETPYETRFFTVSLNSEGTALSVNTGSIAAIETGDAIMMAQEIYQTGRDRGFVNDYRYMRMDTDSGAMIIFIDCHKTLNNFGGFLLSSLLVSAIALLSVFLLVFIFSKIVFKPVAESDRKQKQFITDAGHEIKTPLTIIDANTEVLEMMGGENEWTQSIRNQVKRLSALTTDLIALSRLDEGGQQLQKIDFPLSDAVAETAESFRTLATTREKNLNIQVTKDLSYCGDEKSIRQLVAILLDNAMKYSDDHGHIRLTLKRHGRGFSLAVFNTAQAIDQEHLGQLFERFYRSDSSRNSAGGGYGIGLSIARAIVTAHKGKISARSDDGKSLTIIVLM